MKNITGQVEIITNLPKIVSGKFKKFYFDDIWSLCINIFFYLHKQLSWFQNFPERGPLFCQASEININLHCMASLFMNAGSQSGWMFLHWLPRKTSFSTRRFSNKYWYHHYEQLLGLCSSAIFLWFNWVIFFYVDFLDSILSRAVILRKVCWGPDQHHVKYIAWPSPHFSKHYHSR